MNDFNRGALPVPCLRLNYGFGEQWASVELGDGTGYVRLSDYEKAMAENAKLRELVRSMWVHSYCCIAECFEDDERHIDDTIDRMRELGIEVKP